jgi:hypothetical protein
MANVHFARRLLAAANRRHVPCLNFHGTIGIVSPRGGRSGSRNPVAALAWSCLPPNPPVWWKLQTDNASALFQRMTTLAWIEPQVVLLDREWHTQSLCALYPLSQWLFRHGDRSLVSPPI